MPRIDGTSRDAAVNAWADRADVGAGTAVIQLRTGSAPASIGDAAAGTLLAEFALDNPAFDNAPATATGVVTLQGVPLTDDGLDDDTIGHARVVNRNGDAIMDTEDVVEAPASGTVVVDTTTVSTGLTLNLISATVTMPAGSV